MLWCRLSTQATPLTLLTKGKEKGEVRQREKAKVKIGPNEMGTDRGACTLWENVVTFDCKFWRSKPFLDLNFTSIPICSAAPWGTLSFAYVSELIRSCESGYFEEAVRSISYPNRTTRSSNPGGKRTRASTAEQHQGQFWRPSSILCLIRAVPSWRTIQNATISAKK